MLSSEDESIKLYIKNFYDLILCFTRTSGVAQSNVCDYVVTYLYIM